MAEDDELSPFMELIGEGLRDLLRDSADGSGAPSAPGWSSFDPVGFWGIRDRLYADWADSLDVKTSDLPLDLDDFTRVLKQFGGSEFDTNGRFPTFDELGNSSELWTRVQRRTLDLDIFPKTMVIDGEIYVNDPSVGVFPVPLESVKPGESALAEAAETSLRGLDLRRAMSGVEESEAAGALGIIDRRPSFTAAGLQEFMATAVSRRTKKPTGGGRRISFDRTHAAEGLRSQWRALLRQEPSNVGGMLSEFEGSANAILRGGGASPNFETWVLNKIRGTPRYQTLYGRKDESQSEVEYLQGFLVAEQFGLDPRIANREIVRGLSTGAAPAAFAESVAFSRDVQALGQGSFSRRFANLINQMGPLQSA